MHVRPRIVRVKENAARRTWEDGKPKTTDGVRETCLAVDSFDLFQSLFDNVDKSCLIVAGIRTLGQFVARYQRAAG